MTILLWVLAYVLIGVVISALTNRIAPWPSQASDFQRGSEFIAIACLWPFAVVGAAFYWLCIFVGKATRFGKKL